MKYVHRYKQYIQNHICLYSPEIHQLTWIKKNELYHTESASFLMRPDGSKKKKKKKQCTSQYLNNVLSWNHERSY